MKKRHFFLFYLLAFSLLFSACAGSVSQPSDTTGDEPNASSDHTSSEGQNKPIPTTISSVNRTLTPVNLAEGKTYTSSVSASKEYPDTGKKLTDGALATSFDKSSWVGYSRPERLELVLDLGRVETQVADLAVCVLRDPTSGIGIPLNFTIEVSEDGNEYRSLGKVYPAVNSPNGMLELGLKLAEPVSARYVRYVFTNCESSWLFLGELKAVRYEDVVEEPYYGSHTLPKVDTPSEWDASEPDYQDTINLIAGQTPIVTSHQPIVGELATEYYNSVIALPRLTDGKYASSSSYSDSAFVHFTQHDGRSLCFDLQHTSAVSSVQFSFLKDASAGIRFPNSLAVLLSDDGVLWQQIFYNSQIDSADGSNWYRETITFEHTYRARFVRIDMTLTTHVYCDELQVYGSKAIPENAMELKPSAEEPDNDLGYIKPEDFLGVHNMLLSYHCLPANGEHTEDGLITVNEYLPYVGYYDKTGKLADTFFDAYLYLPYTRFNYADEARSLSGWNFYLDDIYMENRNMSALNQAIEKISSELSLSDYRCKVFTSILYPWKTLSDNKTVNTFGDLDGDGVLDSFAELENRKAAVRWMMDQEYTRFQAGNYQNLEFGGFYWFEENIDVSSAEEKELILYAADYAHALGVKFFWIPYYCASGYDRWAEYGFDLACMQPNYMFSNTGDISRLYYTAEKTRRLGMCVEMELDGIGSQESIRRYMKYLKAGADYGFMNSVKLYYQSNVPGAFHAAKLSNDAFGRAVYDLTYQFAKGTFSSEIPEYSVNNRFEVSSKMLRGKKIIQTKSPCTVELAVSPVHGDLQLSSDGTFSYYLHTEEEFSGTDYFAVTLDFGYAKTEEIIIALDVNLQ